MARGSGGRWYELFQGSRGFDAGEDDASVCAQGSGKGTTHTGREEVTRTGRSSSRFDRKAKTGEVRRLLHERRKQRASIALLDDRRLGIRVGRALRTETNRRRVTSAPSGRSSARIGGNDVGIDLLDLSGEVNFGLEEIVEVDEGGSTTNEDLLERRLREEDELAW